MNTPFVTELVVVPLDAHTRPGVYAWAAEAPPRNALSVGLGIATLGWPDQTNRISTAAWTLLTSLLTFLAAEAKQAGAFFFGSTAGSQAKDAALVEIAKQP